MSMKMFFSNKKKDDALVSLYEKHREEGKATASVGMMDLINIP